MTPEEKKRLEELVEKKKTQKLDDKEFAEFKKLVTKSKGKGNPKRDRKSKEKQSFDPGNDPEWWKKIPELVRDSASFKCNYIAGTRIDATKIPYVIPGVLEVKLMTCYLAGSEPTDPINVWARNNYLKMFQKYRPVSNYSASDQGITLLAGLEAVKLIALYERIYGMINRYSVLNVNMPTVEAEALGLAPATLTYLQGHLSDFRYDLNYLVRKAQRLCIPKEMTFINDIVSLLNFEYIDHNNPRGQIILFNLSNYGVYSDTALSTGGSISFNPDLMNDLFDFNANNMCKALDTVLNALLGSDSVQRIFADLVVWFGEDAMLQFQPVPEDYMIVPVESKSILHKLHNLESKPSPMTSGGALQASILTSWARSGLSSTDEANVLNGAYNIYQFNDSIVTTGVFKDSGAGTPVNFNVNGVAGKVLIGGTSVISHEDVHVIDGYDVEVTEDFVIEGSLLKANYQSIGNSGTPENAAVATSCVYWVVASMYFHANGATATRVYNWSTVVGPAMQQAGLLALIDWAPLSYHMTGSVGARTISGIYGDIDVIIPVSGGNLNRIQRACFLSGLEYNPPIKV